MTVEHGLDSILYTRIPVVCPMLRSPRADRPSFQKSAVTREDVLMPLLERSAFALAVVACIATLASPIKADEAAPTTSPPVTPTRKPGGLRWPLSPASALWLPR